ncbi:MAG: IPT/TIG domain-containing protein [Acidimicrobiia bacterium]
MTPRVDSFTPLLGPAGTTVTVSGRSFTNATAVRFNGVTAGFSSVTDTQLVAVVPAGATTGPLTIVTPDGSGAGAINYTVTTSPDLTALQTNSPSIVSFGSNVTITITVTNSRASIASGVTLTDTLPTGYTFVSATSSQGTPTFASGMVTCPIGAVTNGQAVTVTIVATAAVNGLAENRVNLTLIESDFNSSDNFGSLYIPVVTEAERTLSFDYTASSPRFVLHWPFSAANFKLEFNTNLVSTGNTWTVAPEAVVLVTNNAVLFNYVTNDTLLPRKFYRLRAP